MLNHKQRVSLEEAMGSDLVISRLVSGPRQYGLKADLDAIMYHTCKMVDSLQTIKEESVAEYRKSKEA